MSQEEYDYDYDDFANDDDIVDHGPYLNLDGDDPKWTPYPPENDPYEMMDAYKAQAEKEAKGKERNMMVDESQVVMAPNRSRIPIVIKLTTFNYPLVSTALSKASPKNWKRSC
ncbi:hypothetical protein DIURU_002753 [Diutina rugosa]|uniref:Uncharacterized protein n=1 Tax=Diutina rugosa TaxID=5481 RepID=A0A642UP37_DIURU|nr:uncharacterized protein DIURU_002753 [Diutina rugosa]KAA8902644.1 hypothetical protein DIURU_002753 [Diutina rugosa]